MTDQIVPLKRRASRFQPSASQNYAGHSAGIHPEDDPYWTDAQDEDDVYEVKQPPLRGYQRHPYYPAG